MIKLTACLNFIIHEARGGYGHRLQNHGGMDTDMVAKFSELGGKRDADVAYFGAA